MKQTISRPWSFKPGLGAQGASLPTVTSNGDVGNTRTTQWQYQDNPIAGAFPVVLGCDLSNKRWLHASVALRVCCRPDWGSAWAKDNIAHRAFTSNMKIGTSAQAHARLSWAESHARHAYKHVCKQTCPRAAVFFCPRLLMTVSHHSKHAYRPWNQLVNNSWVVEFANDSMRFGV